MYIKSNITWYLLLGIVVSHASCDRSGGVAAVETSNAFEWATATTRGNLNFLLRNVHNASSGVSSRDLTNGALAALLLDTISPAVSERVHTERPGHVLSHGCDTALSLLQDHGMGKTNLVYRFR